MELSFSVVTWRNALLVSIVLISCIDVYLMDVGVYALGGSGSVTGGYIIASISLLVLCLTFIGCFAALRESHLLSVLYIALSVLLILSEIVFMITFASMKDTFMESTLERVQDLWDDQQIKPGSMDNLQNLHSCCGKDSAQDYLRNDNDVLPKSCCRLFDCSDVNNIHVQGCSVAAVNDFDDQSDYLILTLLGTIALEVLGVASAYYMIKHLQQGKRKTTQQSVCLE